MLENRFYRKLLFTVCMLVAIGLWSSFSQNLGIKPRIENGVLDLSNWAFERDGIVELRGQWGFVEGIANLQEPIQQFASVPGEMPITENQGAGTYYLKVIFPSAMKRTLAVDVEGVRMSNALIVNNQLIHVEGRPANNRERYIARNIPYTAQFTADGRELNIRVQVANFDYYKTGIHLPIYLGTAEQINKRQVIQFIFEASMLLMAHLVAFIFLVVYFSFNKEKSGLILGVYFLVLMVLIATTNQKMFLQIFPEAPFLMLVKIRDFAMYFSIPLLIFYAKSLFPQVKRGWLLLQVIAMIYLVYSFIILLVPYQLVGGIGDFILLPLFNVVYLILVLSMLNKYRKGNASVINRGELEYFILFLIAEAGIIYSSGMYYANVINNLWLSVIAACFAGTYMVLMFIEKFKETYLSMEHYAAKLEREIHLKDEFLFRTSHELKTPLHGMMNLAQLSLDRISEGELSAIEKNNRLIKATARRMSLIVNDLVDFSLIQENKFRMTMREIDLLYCIHSVVEVLDYQAREKDVTIHIKVLAEARYAVADEARFIQVIYNLVQNSLHHTKGGVITISSQLVQNQIRLLVEDTGMGIPQSEQERIFEAYEQGSYRLTSGGLGLGLAISRQLVLQMNGTLALDWSEVGKGARFSIYIEKASASLKAPTYERVEHHAEVILEHQLVGEKVTILIVDDEPLNRKVLRELLMYQDGTILEADNGEQVLQLLDARCVPDLILLDVMLEDMTGYEICRQIRENYSLIEMPVLFITVNHSIRDINQAFLVGGNDFLTKPFEAEEVRARVNTLLQMKRLAEQATETEMAFLQSQIKPHFLFNTLSAIMAFTYEDSEKTRTLLASLSTYLRTVFQTSKQTEWILLRTELELTQAFVVIQRQRYGDRLNLTFDIEQNLLNYITPPLLLQPLVENAIEHGVLKRAEGGHVHIVIEKWKNGIRITVQDNGIGMTAEKIMSILSETSSASGVGLANVQKRVLRLTKQPLTINSTENEGTTISYWIPFNLVLEVKL